MSSTTDEIKTLQENYYTQFSKSTDILHSKVLFCAFHPLEAFQNDHVLLIEEVEFPESMTLVHLQDHTVNDRKQSDLSSLISKDDPNTLSIDELVNQKQENQCELEVDYSHVKLKNDEIKYGKAEVNVNLNERRFSSTFNQQLRMFQYTYKHKDFQDISVEDLEEVSNKNLLEKPRELLNQVLTTKYSSCYRISLWRLNEGKLILMESKFELKSQSKFSIYNDSLFFSHDGNFIFVLLQDDDQKLMKAVIVKSEDLSMPDSFEVELAQYDIDGNHLQKQIIASMIEDDPALIWGHKDSYDVGYMRKSDRVTELGSYTQPYFLYNILNQSEKVHQA